MRILKEKISSGCFEQVRRLKLKILILFCDHKILSPHLKMIFLQNSKRSFQKDLKPINGSDIVL